MGDSIWKKEISFGRKPQQAKPPAAPASDAPAAADSAVPFWKKDVSLGRKTKQAAPPVEAEPRATDAAAAPAGGAPFWKKELSLGRKARSAPANPAVPQAVAPQPAETTPSEATPFWKKEFSFGRNTRAAPADSVVPAPAEADPQPRESTPFWRKALSLSRTAAAPVDAAPSEPGESVPFWKKEIGFSRKTKATAVAAPEAAVVSAAEDVAPDIAARIAPWVAAAAQAAAAGAAAPAGGWTETPELAPEPVPAPAPQAPAPALPAQPAAATPGVTVEPARAAPAAPAPVAEPLGIPSAPASPVIPAAAAADPVVPPTPPAAAPADPVPLATPAAGAPAPAPPAPVVPPELDPAASPVPVATPRVEVNPPVPAAELPPLAEAKVPFWKRDVGRKAQSPGAPKPEKKPRVRRSFARPKLELPTRARGADGTREKPLKERGGGKVPKKLVGLKIGGSQLAAARIQNNGVAELVQIARAPLDPGVVVGGELRDPEALSEALKAFFAHNKLPKRGVRLGIANNRIGVRTFEIAGIEEPKQLANAIRFRAQEALPIPIEEAVVDYHVLSERQDEEGKTVRRVLLVVAYRDLVDRYVDACKKAGVQLAGIDLEAFALLRALAEPQDGAGGDSGAALVAVAIGHDRSTFAVSDGRTCEFTRVLEWGGAMLNVAIARELNATPSQVEDLKRALSLADTDVPEGVTPEQATAAREAARKQVQVFARELVSSLQFYQSQPGSLGIGEIVLTGGTAHLGGLAEELQRLIGVHVRVGDPLSRVKVPKKFDEPDQVGSLSIAIGLGIED